jgi:NAD(P)-dependent dehydrogenase (short-subunit alcohol dehydrogenase family)
MDLKLTGKTAVVTGAGRGIGFAVVKELAREGVLVAAAARTITPELRKSAAVAVSADLATKSGALTLVHAALEELDGIDILVNNVGFGDVGNLNRGGFLDADDEQWRSLLDRNLFSAVWTTHAALPSLLERRGAIVNMSSINARVPSTGPVGYSEAKAALTAFGKRLSEEFGPRGVRVNTVSPGAVGSSLWRSPDGYGATAAAARGMTLDEFLASLPEQLEMTTGRLAEPEEIARLVVYLASDATPNLIGSDVLVHGGSFKAV